MSGDSFETLHNAIATALTGDSILTNAMVASLASGGVGMVRAASVIRGNRPLVEIAQVHQSRLPVWVIEPGEAREADITQEGGGEPQTIGSHSQGYEIEMLVALVWVQQDTEAAHTQRLRLLDLFPKWALRHASMAGASGIFCRELLPDQGATHPNQTFRAGLRADMNIHKG